MDIDDVIQTAAQLVDAGIDVDDEYRRGVVELANALCLPDVKNTPEAVIIMGYAVCGVNRQSVQPTRSSDDVRH